jgi:hypothetical protein
VPEKIRQANAKAAASKYAPKPDGSTLTYGLIAVSVLAVTLAVYGRFYDVDMLSEPVALVVASLAAFAFGAGIRLLLQQRHAAAYRAEYALRQRASTAAGQTEAAPTTLRNETPQ